MVDPELLRRRIEAFLSADPRREVTEDGEWLFDLSRTRYRLEEAHGKLLLHLWSEERTWVRRVLKLAEETPDRLVVEVARFGQRRPARLVFARPARRSGSPGDRNAARRAYGRFLRRLLQREFLRTKVEGLSTIADLRRSFSGLYTRARLCQGNRWWAVLGVGAGEDAAAVDGILTYGLIWLEANRERYPERVWAGLRLFLPAGKTQTTLHRLAYLDPERVPAELFAVDQQEFTCRRVDLHDRGNLETRLEIVSHVERIRTAESSSVERIRQLAPDDIESVVPAGRNELVLRFRGLEFARATAGQVVFGVKGEETLLTGENFPALAKLVECLVRERKAGGTPKRSFYRWQAESWLEGLVERHPQRVDSRLRSSPLYRQVLVAGGAERGVADLLGITREGQLVVLELKASADIHLPLQGLDYWLRLYWHHQRGGLAAAGYFPRLEIQSGPPLLLLVAPALQFHPTTEMVVRCLEPTVRVALVGLNEDWRKGLRVVWRKDGQRF